MRAGLDQRRQRGQRHPPAGVIVGRRDAGRQPFVDCDHFGPVINLAEGARNRHLPAQGRIIGLELIDLDDLLVRYEFQELPR